MRNILDKTLSPGAAVILGAVNENIARLWLGSTVGHDRVEIYQLGDNVVSLITTIQLLGKKHRFAIYDLQKKIQKKEDDSCLLRITFYDGWFRRYSRLVDRYLSFILKIIGQSLKIVLLLIKKIYHWIKNTPGDAEPINFYRIKRPQLKFHESIECCVRFAPGNSSDIKFLHGSCNFPVKNLADIGSMAVGYAGTMVSKNLAKTEVIDRKNNLYQILWLLLSKPLFYIDRAIFLALSAFNFNRVESAVVVKSPMLGIIDEYQDRKKVLPDFMIHAGDQIYYDFPLMQKKPEYFEYCVRYFDAWARDPDYASILACMPHYMIWDDHEIVNNFPDIKNNTVNGVNLSQYLQEATAAYIDMVHCRNDLTWSAEKLLHHHESSKTLFDDNQTQKLWYVFDYGNSSFFVMDTRSERIMENTENLEARMISQEQMNAFKYWLIEKRDRVKFVVSSVPFVAEINSKHGTEEADDKWCGSKYGNQRKEIIDFLLHPYFADEERQSKNSQQPTQQSINNLIFLVGDMHSTYYSSMSVQEQYHKRIFIHELAGGPIYQLQHSRLSDYETYISDEYFPNDIPRIWSKNVSSSMKSRSKVSYEVRMEKHLAFANSVMEVSVANDVERSKDTAGIVDWRIVRTARAQMEGSQRNESSTISGSIRVQL